MPSRYWRHPHDSASWYSCLSWIPSHEVSLVTCFEHIECERWQSTIHMIMACYVRLWLSSFWNLPFLEGEQKTAVRSPTATNNLYENGGMSLHSWASDEHAASNDTLGDPELRTQLALPGSLTYKKQTNKQWELLKAAKCMIIYNETIESRHISLSNSVQGTGTRIQESLPTLPGPAPCMPSQPQGVEGVGGHLPIMQWKTMGEATVVFQ